MKKFKKLFKNKSQDDRNDLVVTKDHSINADELANYIRNLEAENRDLKDSTTENNTISYKLGKTIIDTLNKQSSTTEFPSKLLKVYAESRKRKLPSLKGASLLDKAIILLTDEKLLESYRLTGNKIGIANKPQNINTKQSVTTILGNVLNTIEEDHFILKNQPHNNLVDNLIIESVSNTPNQEVDVDINYKFNSEVLVDLTIKDNNVIELTQLEVQSSGDTLEISAAVLYRLKSELISRKAVVLLDFLDATGTKVQNIDINGIGVSAAFGQYFRYLNNNCSNVEENLKDIIKLQLPPTIASVKIYIAGMGLKGDEQINLRLKAHCYNEQKEEVITSEAPIDITVNSGDKVELTQLGVQAEVDTLEVSAAVLYRLKSELTSRKAVILLDILDASGNKIQDIPGLGVSALFNQLFRYLNNNCTSIEQDLKSIIKIKIPDSAVSIKISVAGMGLKDDEQVDVRLRACCYNEKVVEEFKRQRLISHPLPKPITSDPSNKRYTSDLNVACILDEFTIECLSHEVKLIKITQEDWPSQLEKVKPDFLLVESCWRGNDGNWGTLTRGSGGGRKLGPLLQYCKKNNIPTVFWNKEDPPHYEKFGAVAKLFDVAITTDINMVERYKTDFDIDVYPLSFAAQPKIHNPVPTISRLDKAVFAGSYYRDKSKRCADFDELMSEIEMAGVAYDIFDRNHYRDVENFIYPDHYHHHIVGSLPAEDMWKAHKGYKYQINMNTVQNSSTMFARRVYESLASGTPVISNDSVGVSELFGDLVIMPNKEQTITEQLRELESSSLIYENRARRGVRRVMREHTYGHRIQQICRLLGMDVEVTVPKATLAITASSETDVVRAEKIFESQTAVAKHLFIELENFDTAHQFLNKSNNTTSYSMKLGHAFYNNERQYYGNDKVLKCNVNDKISAEALEDFIYWGEL